MFPANAGMIPVPVVFVSVTRCVPRECGDDPNSHEARTTRFQVFPANAGMIPPKKSAKTAVRCVPRECGDDPL